MIIYEADVEVSVVELEADIESNSLIYDADITAEYNMVDANPYEGQYEFEPGREAQIIHTENLFLEHDIIIDPIPQNYGLITWNGAILTVT